MMKRRPILDTIIALMPWHWIQDTPYSKEWDRAINYLLDQGHKPKNIDRHTADLGPFTIWISNFSFAFGRPYSHQFREVYASRRTKIRLKRVLDGERKINYQKVIEEWENKEGSD